MSKHDREALRFLQNAHYAFSGCALAIVYTFALALFLPNQSPASGTALSSVELVAILLTPILAVVVLRFIVEIIDSRERMYDATYQRIVKAGRFRKVEVEIRLSQQPGNPIRCRIDSVGTTLLVTDHQGFAYEFSWTKVEAMGVRDNIERTLDVMESHPERSSFA